MKNLVSPNEAKNLIGKANSQFIKTWFIDGHIEAILLYTDSSYYAYPVEYMDHMPHAGDPKHYQWVWEKNQWIVKFEENY